MIAPIDQARLVAGSGMSSVAVGGGVLGESVSRIGRLLRIVLPVALGRDDRSRQLGVKRLQVVWVEEILKDFATHSQTFSALSTGFISLGRSDGDTSTDCMTTSRTGGGIISPSGSDSSPRSLRVPVAACTKMRPQL